MRDRVTFPRNLQSEGRREMSRFVAVEKNLPGEKCAAAASGPLTGHHAAQPAAQSAFRRRGSEQALLFALQVHEQVLGGGVALLGALGAGPADDLPERL